MRQYPIWNQVTACIYQSNKSYGVKETGDVEIRVGVIATYFCVILQLIEF